MKARALDGLVGDIFGDNRQNVVLIDQAGNTCILFKYKVKIIDVDSLFLSERGWNMGWKQENQQFCIVKPGMKKPVIYWKERSFVVKEFVAIQNGRCMVRVGNSCCSKNHPNVFSIWSINKNFTGDLNIWHFRLYSWWTNFLLFELLRYLWPY